jgi:Domain of unknown function (DUF3859)
MRRLIAGLILVACCGDAFAQGTKVDRIEIVEVGVFRAETETIELAPGTATGKRNILSDTQLASATTRVEAKIGVHFGMRYRVLGQPNGGSVKLMSVTQYPAPGLKNPGTGQVKTRGDNMLFATISALNYRGYVFEYDWEMVPGIWIFEIWDGDKRKLASQAFEVVRP